MSDRQFKIVVQKAAGLSFDLGTSAYEMEREALDPIGAEIVEVAAETEDEFIDAARDADALIGRGRRITRRIIENLDKCVVIGLGSVGADTVDVDAATEHGIVVTNVPDVFIEEAADHALGLLLAAFRRLSTMHSMTVEGRWAEGRPLLSEFPRLWGQTIGLISFGNVARAVARRCPPFGLRVLAYDPFVGALEMSGVGVEPVISLMELLERSDFVSMHAPLRGEVLAFDSDGLVLSNGVRVPADLVCVCCGNEAPSFPFLPASYRAILEGQEGGPALYRHLIDPRIPRLGFSGFNAGFLHIALVEMGALWQVAALRGDLALPPAADMLASARRVADWKRECSMFEPVCNIAVSTRYQQYLDILLQDLGISQWHKLPNLPAELFARYDPTDYKGVVQKYLAKSESRRAKGKLQRLAPADA